MYSKFLLLALLTSLATSAPFPPSSPATEAGNVARNLGQVDESTIITRQLRPSNTENNQRTSGDATGGNGNSNFAVNRLTSGATGWHWRDSNYRSGAEKQTRDTARVDASKNTATATSKDLQPKARPYEMAAEGTQPELLQPGEVQSEEVPPQAEASGVPDQGGEDPSGGKGDAITDGSLNGMAFMHAESFPHR